MRRFQACGIIGFAEDDASPVIVEMRGGAKLCIEKAGPDQDPSLIRVSFVAATAAVAPSGTSSALTSCSDTFGRLRSALLMHGWNRAIAEFGVVSEAAVSTSNVALPTEEMTRFFCRLNLAALRVADQIRVLQSAQSDVREVVLLAAEFRGDVVSGASRGDASLSITITLLLHGPNTASDELDAVRCVLELVTDAVNFPHISDSSEVRIRRVTGAADARGKKAVIEAGLQGWHDVCLESDRVPTFLETMDGAVKAMRHAAFPSRSD